MEKAEDGRRPAREIHLFEQTQAMLGDVATALGAYRKALIEAGVPDALADRLVLRAERRMMGRMGPDSE
jgi:hypothetical protein